MLKYIKKYISLPCVLSLFLVILIYMHESVAGNMYDFPKEQMLSHYIFMLIDICSILLFVGLILSLCSFIPHLKKLRERRIIYSVSYVMLFVWCLANIVYSRFFQQYMMLSALGEVSNFNGTWWVSYIKEAFRWKDLILVLTSVIFILEVFCRKASSALWHSTLQFKLLPSAIAILLFFRVGTIFFGDGIGNNTFSEYLNEVTGYNHKEQFMINQEAEVYSEGVIRCQILCALYNYKASEKITDEDIKYIQKYIDDRNRKIGELSKDAFNTASVKNVIFILVESWMDFTKDLVVNNVEITPNLNRLAQQEDAYYNGRMRDNKTCGESSDAQVLYFTGLYPLASEVTVGRLLHNKIPALPNLLKNKKGMTTHMTLPTKTNFWHQADVNKVYGIDSCYSANRFDWAAFGFDEDVFCIATEKQRNMESAFVHFVLTISMHSPYTFNPGVDLTDSISSNTMSPEMINYLQRCHYTDREIGKYITQLKKDGLFANSLIVITADHSAHATFLNSTEEEIGNSYIPLLILNGNINNEMVVNGDINQIDVFPSLLDLLNVESSWRGLGYSIFRKDSYTNVLTDETRLISAKIIKGDYFRNSENTQ